MRRSIFSAAVVFATFATHTARADEGFALDRFDPSERGSEWFAQDTLDLRGNMRFAAGVVGDWAYKPLVAYAADGSERMSIVEHQAFAHVGASVVLVDRVRFGLNLPIAVFQDGTAGSVNGVAYPAATKTTLGDVRVSGDVRLLGVYGEPFTLAAGVQVFAPTGSREQWTGDERVRVVPRLQAAGDIGMFAWAARVGAAYRALSRDDFAGSKLGSELSFGASVGVRLLDKKLLLGPEVFGTTVFSDAFARQTTPFELLVGAHYTAGDFRVGAGVGPGLTRGFGAPQLRGLLSLEWAPAIEEKPVVEAPRDRDGDGIVDEKDACPEEKGVATDDPTTNGCPVRDDDKDGIANAQDACPTVAGIKSDDPKKNGCPPDKDGDGIIDADDACPEVVGVKSDDPKKHGCPPDKDGDGIVDGEDACPDVKGIKSADPKTNGCPGDRDGDSVYDDDDACPDAPGPKNEDPKKNGCPAAAIVAGEIKILQQVKFKTDSAVILKESDEILTAVAKILVEHPEILKIEIQGHTDNKGGKAHNLDLSKKRAASVMTWLTTKGKIDKKRLVSDGFGEEKPIDTNDTEAGRQNNRRVEFRIVEQGDPPAKTEPKPKK